MSGKRFSVATVISLSSLYLATFVPVNLTGAKDPNMLAAFWTELQMYGTDEFAQFVKLMHMATWGRNAYETLQNVLFYNYFPYGYPFFLLSLVAIVPLKLLQGFFGVNVPATAYVFVLRELNSLFMLLSILLLVFLWTQFRSVFKSTALFVLLASVPAVFFNNMFWHPDSLVTLFAVLTIFCLVKDDLSFGTWFYLAAATCGVAVGTKVIGIFFFLSIGSYLLLGMIQLRLRLNNAVKYAFAFVVIMVLTFFVANPLLTIPSIAKDYVLTLRGVVDLTAAGFNIPRPVGPVAWYEEALRDWLGFWWLYVVAFLLALAGIIYNPKRRILNLMVLTWMAPLSLYILFTIGLKSSYYFIPVFLPMLSCVANVFDFQLTSESGPKKTAALLVAAATIAVCSIQFGYYASYDFSLYSSVLNRESRSTALRFYRALNDAYLAKLPEDKHLTVAREAKLYVPTSPKREDHFKWGVLDYDYINAVKPDLILLSQSTVTYVAPPVDNAQEAAWKAYTFYHDAQMDSLKGFRKVVETDFGVAFVKSSGGSE